MHGLFKEGWVGPRNKARMATIKFLYNQDVHSQTTFWIRQWSLGAKSSATIKYTLLNEQKRSWLKNCDYWYKIRTCTHTIFFFILQIISQWCWDILLCSKLTVLETKCFQWLWFICTYIRKIQLWKAFNGGFHWEHAVGESQFPISVQGPAATTTWWSLNCM